MPKYQNASIHVVLNGFVVEIGCQTVVAETPEKLKELICNYIDDPVKTEREMMGQGYRDDGSRADRPLIDPGQAFPPNAREPVERVVAGRSLRGR